MGLSPCFPLPCSPNYGVPLREYVEAGFLLSYGPSYAEHCRQAATYVDQILKGAKPANVDIDSRKVVKEAARTIKKHRDGILAWFDSRIANGLIEDINSLVQAAKAKARGYRSLRNLVAITYLIAGKIDIRLPT